MANGKSGAPLGNDNATKARPWSDAIRRAVARLDNTGDGSGLNRLAEKLLDKVQEGDMTAIKEFGDRYEGKVPNVIEGTGPGGSIIVQTTSDDGSVL